MGGVQTVTNITTRIKNTDFSQKANANLSVFLDEFTRLDFFLKIYDEIGVHFWLQNGLFSLSRYFSSVQT